MVKPRSNAEITGGVWNFRKRALNFLKGRKIDVIVVSILLIVSGIVSANNMTRHPQRLEDEGTYVSQAMAIKSEGTLTHYTYWYDHPPLGWIQIAGYFVMSNSVNRHDTAISAGREFMLILHLTSIVLLYALARRLKMGIAASAIGTLAFGLSPLVVDFSRYVLLDNVALPWLLASLFLALSPKSKLSTAIASAVCFAIAILSKETFLALLPVVAFCLWQTSDKRNRRYIFTNFAVVFIAISSLYLLYAILKNELIPGEDHVSLLGSFYWQLISREGSGSIFDASSSGHGLVNFWLSIDGWLLLAGLLTMPISLAYRNLRSVGLSLMIGFLLMLRTGYLPYPYVIILLPFAALSFAGATDRLIIKPLVGKKIIPFKILSFAAAVSLLAIVVINVIPDWHSALSYRTQADSDYSSRQAVDWISENVPKNNRMVVESALWTDLQNKGYNQPEPVWLYKTETDPAVSAELGGWRGIDYIVLNGPTIGFKGFEDSFPTVSTAIDHAELINEFGKDNQKILIYKVNSEQQLSKR